MASVASTTTNLQTTTLQGTQSTQSTLTVMPSNDPGCCGIFCVAALAPETRQLVLPVLVASDPGPIIDPGIHSQTPELPFRPPISHPSI